MNDLNFKPGYWVEQSIQLPRYGGSQNFDNHLLGVRLTKLNLAEVEALVRKNYESGNDTNTWVVTRVFDENGERVPLTREMKINAST